MKSTIIISTLNARYIHTAFGLRYLYANMGNLQAITTLQEFSIRQRPIEIVEKLLQHPPKIIGFGVFIWNVAEIAQIVATLKQVAPEIIIILGGPEVSHPPDLPDMAQLADYIVSGQGEISFPQLCQQVLDGQAPDSKIISGTSAAPTNLLSPYPFYTDIDIQQRIVYVEASRGCPYKCEFCLSSLDATAKSFDIPRFLQDMADLYLRGARHFKFIDRTFNLKTDTSIAILEFFLARSHEPLYLHFEVVPDNLPERLKQIISQFPAGMLQFEVGVQSFDSDIQQRISRRQDNNKTLDNLRWLRQHTGIHIHADLIAGLPGDTLDNFGKSFDQLIALNPQEIQVGILKRLRGAPVNRHTQAFDMRYDPNPPYSILSTAHISFTDMQRLNRFARFWDLIGNSGRFNHALPVIFADQPFIRFMQLSDALYQLTDSTWQIALKRLFELLYTVMTQALTISITTTEQVLTADYQLSGEKGLPNFLSALKYRESESKRQNTGKRLRQTEAAENT